MVNINEAAPQRERVPFIGPRVDRFLRRLLYVSREEHIKILRYEIARDEVALTTAQTNLDDKKRRLEELLENPE